jgi:hypothetical protein
VPEEQAIDRRRILWVGPLTIVAAIAAVQVVRVAAIATLSLPPEGFQPFGWFFPIFDTLVLSMIPDIRMHTRRPNLFTWPRTSALMAMHVAAWWVTVTILSRLTACSKSRG